MTSASTPSDTAGSTSASTPTAGKPGRTMMAMCDADGQVVEHPDLEMLGWDGDCWRPVEDHELIPIPDGSDLFMLPGRLAAGYDREADEAVIFEEPGYQAASVFLAPAYLRTLLPAYDTLEDAPALPLYAYSAVGIRDGELVAPGIRVDEDIRQDPFRFDYSEVEENVAERLAAMPDNRLVKHLTRCALEYQCRAAQNYFLDRFEAPLPAAPTCNAFCVGCISLQPKGGDDQYSAAHDRIGFSPTPQELAEVAVGHIERVGPDAVVSFGQGCEGEPLNRLGALAEVITLIRDKTDVGVVNLNSNASRPGVVDAMCKAGLQSLRVSTNSARGPVYDAYYRPTGYTLDDVRESARVVKRHGGYVMLNYFVFPGVSDTVEELEALAEWIAEVAVDMVQLRNLNIDPEVYLDVVGAAVSNDTAESADGQGDTDDEPPAPMGIMAWLIELRRRFPDLRFGYFNPPARAFDEPAPTLVNA